MLDDVSRNLMDINIRPLPGMEATLPVYFEPMRKARMTCYLAGAVSSAAAAAAVVAADTPVSSSSSSSGIRIEDDLLIIAVGGVLPLLLFLLFRHLYLLPSNRCSHSSYPLRMNTTMDTLDLIIYIIYIMDGSNHSGFREHSML